MKSSISVLILLSAFFFSMPADSAVISVNEFEDRIVIEIDGSMDPKLHKELAKKISEIEVKNVVTPADKVADVQQPAVKAVAKAEAMTEMVKPSANNITTAAVSSSDQSDIRPASVPKAEYNRGQAVMDYMAKMPKREEYLTGRLESMQTRWSKKLAASGLNTIQKQAQ